jgi:hypothetical protein
MKSRKAMSIPAVAFAIVTVAGAPQAGAMETELCSAVLNEHVFNASSSNDIGSVMFEVKNAMCKRDLSTYQSFQRSAEDLQVGIEFAKVAFGLGSSTQDEGGYNSATIQAVCSQAEGIYVSTSDRRWQTIDRTRAISAWEKCIDQASEGVYATVNVDPGLDRFLLRIDDKTKTTSITISSIENNGHPCTFNRNAIRYPYQMQSKRETYECTKNATETRFVSVNTSSGDTYAILIPGTQLTLADAERFRAENDRIGSELSAERTKVTELQKRVSELQAEFKYVKHVTQKEPPRNTIPVTDLVGEAELSCVDDRHPHGSFAGYYGFFEDPNMGQMFPALNHLSMESDGTLVKFKTYDLGDRQRPPGTGTAFIVCSDTQQ